MSKNQRDSLEEGDYHIFIDSDFSQGELNYGELYIKGNSKKEVFLTTYICHPSMANDNLSSVCVLTYIAQWLCSQSFLKYSYRIVFAPETIGAISYLATNDIKQLKQNVVAAFCLSCDIIVFGGGPFFTHNIYPSDIPLLDDLNKINKPMINIGGGWYGRDDDYYCIV